MKPKEKVAIILAITIPLFMVAWMMESYLMPEALGVERTKLWIALMGSIATGLLLWISRHDDN
jgi:uncharacterized membrane protein YhdT